MSSSFTPVHPILPIELAPGITIDFQVIPPVSVQKAAHEAGQPLSFLMGSRGSNPGEEPRHRVIIPQPFYLGTYPVTQVQFACFMPDHQNGFHGLANHPAERINWYQAREFMTWLKAHAENLDSSLEPRLPFEEEWEYACRAGTATEYWNGDGEASLSEVGWFYKNAKKCTHSVGEKNRPNFWGLHDMHGNVWEWCCEVYDSKRHLKVCADRSSQHFAETNEKGDHWKNAASTREHDQDRVIRGGSIGDSAKRCSSASRMPGKSSFHLNGQGFRVLLAPPPSSQCHST